ncbi:hypothetical protein WJX73_007178 [Symbiochloris irregularis]|uniref:Fatty acid desaturase domain-containing protein n=1 Tax=Symbiochloris irregularis TaxID=706552 RepID=A0AAW1P3Q2_9CHLO
MTTLLHLTSTCAGPTQARQVTAGHAALPRRQQHRVCSEGCCCFAQRSRCSRLAARQSKLCPAVAALRRRSSSPVEGPAQRSSQQCHAASPALMPTTDPSLMNERDRTTLAETLGYRSIGAELPAKVSLSTINQSLPRDVFEINGWKAWGAVATSLAAFSLSLGLIAVAPWWLLPFAWAFSGTAFTGFFVIGHDCGHRSFSKNNLLEDIVGTLAFMPLLYPFEPWRIKHNVHHSHTNKLVEDTAWHPIPTKDMEKWGPVQSAIAKFFLGSPLKLWASIGHWIIYHFDLSLYTAKQRPRVIVSLAAVASFALVALPALWAAAGPWGLVKFWFMPWLGYHFWMSTFTVVHHTAPHIPFKPASEWNAAQAQLSGTVHCDYPRWVEFLCHDINVHVPHHVSSKIPWYNLRRATDSLRSNWGEFMTECHWNWRMMRTIFTELHFYSDEGAYTAFDHEAELPFWKLQRALIPNSNTAPWTPKQKFYKQP